jgi:hypothetical protein
MKQQVLTTRVPTPAPTEAASIRPALARIAIGVGLGLTIIGLTDVALLWIPPRFGSIEWEFDALTSTFESLTLVTFGLSLLAAGFLTRGTKAGLYTVSALFTLLLFVVLGAIALFGLNAPVAYRGTPALVRPTMKLILIKTSLLALIYLVLYSYLASSAFKLARLTNRRG